MLKKMFMNIFLCIFVCSFDIELSEIYAFVYNCYMWQRSLTITGYDSGREYINIMLKRLYDNSQKTSTEYRFRRKRYIRCYKGYGVIIWI